jgi:hypothetical protein
MKIIDKREHPFLGSVDSNRPLHTKRVRFCSGEYEKSHNYDQDRKRYFENHRFFPANVAVPPQIATVQLGNSTLLPSQLVLDTSESQTARQGLQHCGDLHAHAQWRLQGGEVYSSAPEGSTTAQPHALHAAAARALVRYEFEDEIQVLVFAATPP